LGRILLNIAGWVGLNRFGKSGDFFDNNSSKNDFKTLLQHTW